MYKKAQKKFIVSLLSLLFVVLVALFSLNFPIGSAHAEDEAMEHVNEAFMLTNATVTSSSAAVPSAVKSDYASGIKFKLGAAGCYIDYNNIIDLRKVEGNVIEFVPNTEVKAFGLKSVRIRLTDAYDATNSIALTFEVNRDGPRLITEGKEHEIKANSTLTSTFINVSFMGAEGAYPNYAAEGDVVVAWAQSFLPIFDFNDAEDDKFAPLGFSYDYSTNCIYAFLQNSGSPSDQHWLIMDLDDDTDNFPDFKGFTTGEVMLTIESTGSTGELVVTKIGNDSMEAVANGGGSSGGLMFGGYDFENMVDGVVNYPYPMPISRNNKPVTAKLEKLNGESWEDITSQLKNEDKEFTPTSVGRYRLSYSNEKASVSGEFNVIAEPIEIVESESVSLAADLKHVFKIPEIAYEGGIGKLTKKYELSINSDTKEVVEGEAIIFDEKGIIASLTVTVTDKVTYSRTFEYPIVINENVKLFNLVDAYDRQIVTSGTNVTVPNFIAEDYSKMNIDAKTEVSITSTFKSGAITVGEQIPVTENGTITYIWGTQTLTHTVICVPKAVDSTSISQFFSEQEDVKSIEITSLGTEFTFNTANPELAMPNPVSTTDLAIDFAIYNRYGLEAKDNYKVPFEKVNVHIVSLEGKEICLTIENLTGLRPLFYVNGKKCGALTSYIDSFVDPNNLRSKNRKFSLIVDESTLTVQNGEGLTVTNLSTWNDGTKFDGFKNGQAQVRFSLDGGEADTKLVLCGISNQKLAQQNLAYGDMAAPAISVLGELKSKYAALNDVIEIPMVYAYDVLSANATIKMTVTTPDGTVLDKVTPQTYTLNLNKAGKYQVSYQMSDKNRNSMTQVYEFTVLDEVAPTITLNGTYKTEYKGSVNVLEATIADNNDSATQKVNFMVFIQPTSMKLTKVEMGETLNLSAGKYNIVYYAIDADGNTTIAKYTFKVK